MILYPVALFQQKIVITNKILHLSPKHFLCISCFFLFLHFKSLSSVRNSFSLLLCNIQLLCIYFFCNYFHNLYNLIQFNASLSTTENRTARSTKWQEGQREYWEQTVQRHHPARLPPRSSQWQPSLSAEGKNHSKRMNLANHLCNQCNWSGVTKVLKLDSDPTLPREEEEMKNKTKQNKRNTPGSCGENTGR